MVKSKLIKWTSSYLKIGPKWLNKVKNARISLKNGYFWLNRLIFKINWANFDINCPVFVFINKKSLIIKKWTHFNQKWPIFNWKSELAVDLNLIFPSESGTDSKRKMMMTTLNFELASIWFGSPNGLSLEHKEYREATPLILLLQKFMCNQTN